MLYHSRKLFALWLAVSASVPTACSSQDPAPVEETGPLYTDVSDQNLPTDDLSGLSMDAAFVDVDRDGDLDIIIAHEFRPNILLINDGTGSFANESDRIPTANHDSEDIGVADFDNDGDPDVVIVSEDDRTNELYLNNGSGTFAEAGGRLPVDGTSNAVEVFDANGDGLPDILIGNNGQNRLIINIGDAFFLDETTSRLPADSDVTQDIDLGDIDGDGDLDIVVGNENENRILINNGSGEFADESDTRLPLRGSQEVTREADFGDLDGDGDLDILFANVTSLVSGGDAQNRILFNDGSGVFSDVTETNYPSSTERSFEGDIIDVDGDGDNDIITGNLPGSGGNTVRFSVFLNDGAGVFESATASTFPPTVRGFGFDVITGDVNGDGLDDLFMASRGSSDILLLRND